MVLNYQRWTPPCGCSFEQEVDSETGEVKLLFTHEVCGGHEDIAKNTKVKPKLTASQITNKKEAAWQRNHDKNIDDFENHPETKKVKDKVAKAVSKHGADKLKEKDPDAFFLNEDYLHEKDMHNRRLNDFTNDRKKDMLLGLESPYALNADEVYDYIVAHPEEQQETAEGG